MGLKLAGQDPRISGQVSEACPVLLVYFTVLNPYTSFRVGCLTLFPISSQLSQLYLTSALTRLASFA